MAGPENMKVDGRNERRVVKMDYPANSHKSQAKYEDKGVPKRPQVKKVVKGKVLTRKKSIWRRIKETFFGEDAGSIGAYVLHDVLIPAAKNTISEMVGGGIEMALFPDGAPGRSSRMRRDKGKSYVSYSKFYDDDRDPRRRKREVSPTSRARHNFNDIIMGSRGEAEEVLSLLVDLTIDYDEATVADLYDLTGVEGTFTDRKYGWDDLSGATVSRVRDGYLINLPKPILLD